MIKYFFLTVGWQWYLFPTNVPTSEHDLILRTGLQTVLLLGSIFFAFTL